MEVEEQKVVAYHNLGQYVLEKLRLLKGTTVARGTRD